MTPKTLTEILSEKAEDQFLLEQERAYFAANVLITRLMDEAGVSRAELARRLGKSRAFVTRLLDGSVNMTIRTISNVLFHLGHRVDLQATLLHDTIEAHTVHDPSVLPDWKLWSPTGSRTVKWQQEDLPQVNDHAARQHKAIVG